MRIIAGQLKGHSLISPNRRAVHPMSEKARGALFNALGDITGLSLLDAFAGSGAVGLEGLSRGARSAILIDKDRAAQNAIGANIRALNQSRKAKLIKASAGAWLATTKEAFDLVILDPPFDQLQVSLIAKLAERTKIGGVLVASLPPAAELSLDSRYQPLQTKTYPDNKLVFYRRVS